MNAKLYLIFSAILWGLNFHLLKVMLTSVHFIEAGFWRFLFGVIFLGLYVSHSFTKWSLFKQHFAGILIVGVFGLFFFNILLFWGLMYTSSINASLIISINPVVTLFLAYFFLKSSIGYSQLIGALIGIIGIVYLLSQGDFLNLNRLMFSKGDILVFIAMIFSSFYHIWVKKHTVNISNKHFTFFTNLVCLVSFAFITPFFVKPHAINYPPQFWIASVLFGVFGTALTYIFWNKGLSQVGASKAGVYMNIVPLSTAIIAVLLSEELAAFHVISGILIFVGLMISQWKTHKMP
jgi:drug/metabolite transporter (DMT)-like permease